MALFAVPAAEHAQIHQILLIETGADARDEMWRVRPASTLKALTLTFDEATIGVLLISLAVD